MNNQPGIVTLLNAVEGNSIVLFNLGGVEWGGHFGDESIRLMRWVTNI